MKRRRWLSRVLPVAMGVVGAACASSPAEPPASPGTANTTGALEEEQSSAELITHHSHHHGGFVGFVLAAVETVGVTPEQQLALDKIEADFRAKVEPVRMANGAVMNALADGVMAGNIDVAKVDAAVAGVSTAAGQLHGATADALNQLHALLRPEQRMALVDKVEAHWAVWKEANAGDQATDNGQPDGHIGHVAKELGLTNDQVEKVRANLSALPAPSRGPFDATAAEAHMKAFGTAFNGETFDAKTLSTADPANTKIASWGASRMEHFYQALAPVLTADQRAKVADKLREHAKET
jgi:Spy/CpxP family protein refolding chaperone